MLGRAPKAPKAAAPWEAMAETLTPLGEPFACGPVQFPPGEWVEVSAGMAKRIELYGWASVREKAVE
jgi:hypothetical protein